jgi:hypothetical protein
MANEGKRAFARDTMRLDSEKTAALPWTPEQRKLVMSAWSYGDGKPKMQYRHARMIRIASEWSAGSGDGLMCYSFASLGGWIHETTLDESGRPRILSEIDGDLRCVRHQCTHAEGWHPDIETAVNEQELLALKAYILRLSGWKEEAL